MIDFDERNRKMIATCQACIEELEPQIKALEAKINTSRFLIVNNYRMLKLQDLKQELHLHKITIQTCQDDLNGSL